ncbi:MAG: hypothetical protein J0H47_05050 [Gammaproteobacteria bacterium]|nr:hypothetical protein [Gammaproteobacteria bacterium]
MMKTQQLLFAILGVILCWLIVPGIFYGLSESLDKAGQLGDVFGVVNALFSGLAFAILIIELSFQRQELKLTRQAMMDQKDQLQAQSEELKKQNYERLFFNLLEIINEEIDSVTGQPQFEKEEGFTLLRTVSSHIDSDISPQATSIDLKTQLETLLKKIIKQEFDIIAEKVWFLFEYIQKIGKRYGAETQIYEDILSNSLTSHVHRVLIFYFLSCMEKSVQDVNYYTQKMSLNIEELLGKYKQCFNI